MRAYVEKHPLVSSVLTFLMFLNAALLLAMPELAKINLDTAALCGFGAAIAGWGGVVGIKLLMETRTGQTPADT